MAAGASAPTHLGETAEMDWRVSPCWHFSRPALLSFSSMFVGMRDGSFPHIYPGPDVPLPPSLPQEAKEGGGAGLPLGTAVAQSISPKPRNFLLPKRKKKKKIPAATFPPCPIGTVETGSVGFPGRVAQGWNTLRQEWWSSLSGPPPGPLWASPLSSPPSPPSKPPEKDIPLLPSHKPGTLLTLPAHSPPSVSSKTCRSLV